MIDINSISFDTIFSGLSVVFSTIVLFMFKAMAKKTENTFDDKIVEAFELWTKRNKEASKKVKK